MRGFSSLIPRFGQLGGQPVECVGQPGETGFGRQILLRERRLGGTCTGERRLGGTQRGPGRPLRFGGAAAVGAGGGERRATRAVLFCRIGNFARQQRQPVLVSKMLGCDRRAGGKSGEAVPPPHPPLAIDEPLAGP